MIWRDDDILWGSHGLDELLQADDTLQEAGLVHTIAIIAETLTPAVARVIRERKMDAQLHCWRHDDLSVDAVARAQLPDAIRKIEDMIGQRPTILFPTWNRVSDELFAEAKALRLRVSHIKVSLEQFIRFRGDVGEDTINFHYWNPSDRRALEEAVQFARKRKRRRPRP